MSSDVVEMERNVTRLQNELKSFESSASALGGPKDTAAVRKRLDQKRQEVVKIIATVEKSVKANKSPGNSPPQFDKLLKQYNDLAKKFEQSDKTARQMEPTYVAKEVLAKEITMTSKGVNYA